MRTDLKEIIANFTIIGDIVKFEPFGNGHINDTFKIEVIDNGQNKKYILQQMNEHVFGNIYNLMQNIYNVTEYIKNLAQKDDKTLEIIPTIKGEKFLNHSDGTKWRVMNFIEGCRSYDIPKNIQMFQKAGYKFGEFVKILEEFDSSSLNVIIPDFHNTRARYDNFKKAVDGNICGRKKTCLAEIEFAEAREFKTDKINNRMKVGIIPLRVTHNDTKLNNLLFDENDEPVCVIDLDTIMPGSLLFDYGDAIRSGCNTADEDEKNLDIVHFDYDMFKAFTTGYVRGLGDSLTEAEKKYLTFAARQMTYECGIRFLTDYLQGDTYFKTDYPQHNLVRSRTQFRLVQEMEDRKQEMKDFVNSL